MERGSTGPEARGTVPTVIVFFGRPSYLQISLNAAAAFRNEVVLLGDESNRSLWKNHWDCDRVPAPKFEAFGRVYVKMSEYPERYERAFWRRPFVLEEWMRREGIDRVFLLDGDVVTFANYAGEVMPRLSGGCAAGLMRLEDQEELELATSMHCSYWTLAALEDFTSFCLAAYTDQQTRGRLEAKYRWHLERRRPGGVCEMTLLELWRTRHEGSVCNLARATGGAAADLAIATAANCRADEYATRWGLKRLVFRDGQPYGWNRKLGRQIRFWCVHCQGSCKALMPLLHHGGYLRRLYPHLQAWWNLRAAVGRAVRRV